MSLDVVPKLGAFASTCILGILRRSRNFATGTIMKWLVSALMYIGPSVHCLGIRASAVHIRDAVCANR